MATRNEVTTKKLKTGQMVKVCSGYKWSVLFSDGSGSLEYNRRSARELAAIFHPARIVRLNPITGVVSK